MSLYDVNLVILKKNMPNLYNQLINAEPIFHVAIQTLEDNLRVSHNDSNCFIHSLYNHNEELNLLFSEVKNDTEIIILFGPGLGYVFPYIENNFPDLKHLIIIEPSLEIFKEYLKKKSVLVELAKINEVSFIVNLSADKAASFVVSNMANNLKAFLLISPAYRQLFSQYSERLCYLIQDNIRNMHTSYVTINYLNTQWTKNTFHNLKNDMILVDSLYKNVFAKNTAVIVSAGPSLNKHLPYLNKLKEKAVIFAVGSSIKILNEAGIIPHFRVIADGLEVSKNIIFNNNLLAQDRVPLIFAHQAYYGILDKITAKKFLLIINTDDLGIYLYNKLKTNFKTIDSSHSVANVTFNMLCASGCKRVVLLGQDMCFQGDKLYAEGREETEAEKNSQKRWIKCKDIFGNTVYSVSQYTAIKAGYESTIKNYPDVEVINATEAGLGVDGSKILSLQEVMDNILTDKMPTCIEDEVNKIWDMNFDNDMILKKEQVIENMKAEINNINLINKRRIDFLQNIYRKLKKGIKKNRISADLSYIEKMEEEMLKIPFYKEVVKESFQVKNRINAMYYDIKNDEVAFEKKIKFFLGQALELEKYLKMIEECLAEKGETDDTE